MKFCKDCKHYRPDTYRASYFMCGVLFTWFAGFWLSDSGGLSLLLLLFGVPFIFASVAKTGGHA